MKLITLALQVDEHFVRMLQATVQLKGLLGPDARQMTALDVLGLVVLGEARGATEEQIHVMTPPEWRPHIEAIHTERRVSEVAG